MHKYAIATQVENDHHGNMNDGGDSIDDVAARLQMLRRWLGYESQTAFAHECDLAVSEVNHYESARRRLPLNAANKIRKRWNVTLDWLYHGDRGGLSVEVNRSLPSIQD